VLGACIALSVPGAELMLHPPEIRFLDGIVRWREHIALEPRTLEGSPIRRAGASSYR